MPRDPGARQHRRLPPPLEEPVVFKQICCGFKPGCRALVSDVREDAPKEDVQQSAAQTDPNVMLWGRKHSVVQAYTVQKIESRIDSIPLRNLCVEVARSSLAVWPER